MGHQIALSSGAKEMVVFTSCLLHPSSRNQIQTLLLVFQVRLSEIPNYKPLLYMPTSSNIRLASIWSHFWDCLGTSTASTDLAVHKFRPKFGISWPNKGIWVPLPLHYPYGNPSSGACQSPVKILRTVWALLFQAALSPSLAWLCRNLFAHRFKKISVLLPLSFS